MNFFEILKELLAQSGFAALTWRSCVMILIAFVLIYLAIKKQFEPLLLLPIAFAVVGAENMNSLTIVTASILAGAVCGDHISPISDTTIMSSSGAQSNHINHVQTQMQYAMVVVAACVPGYLIAGFTENWLITLVSSLAILTAALLYLRRRSLAEDARA